VGMPCAACGGKPDNKNPQGQKPVPRDHNNGYECDGNNGIAKTNPAHTGCTQPSTEPLPCDASVEVCEPTGEEPPGVLGETLTQQPAAVAASAAALPATGSDIATLVGY